MPTAMSLTSVDNYLNPFGCVFCRQLQKTNGERTSLHQPRKYMPAEPESTCHFYVAITYYDSLSLLE